MGIQPKEQEKLMEKEIARLLDQVKSASFASMWIYFFNIISRWMVGGHINQANHLLSLFFELMSHVKVSQRLTPNLVIALTDNYEALWSLTGTRPDDLPASAHSPEDIELGLWQESFSPRKYANIFIDRIKNTELEKLSGNELRVRASIMAYDETRPGHVASSDMLAKASALLDGLLRLEPAVSEKSWPSLTDALLAKANFDNLLCDAFGAQVLLAARLGDPERTKAYLISMAKDHSVGHLLGNGTVAKIALSGVLAPILGITSQRCEDDVLAIEAAVRERLAIGLQPAHGKLTWPQLLKRLNSVRDGKFSRKPATESAIDTAEKRLGQTLPASYRAFLAITNGLKKYYSVGVEIWPVEKIAWLRDIEPELVNLYAQPETEECYQELRKALLIGSEPNGTERLLLLPPDDPAFEWECCFWAHWVPGELRYQTFRSFIENEAQSPETDL
jgi:hypothetical protein